MRIDLDFGAPAIAGAFLVSIGLAQQPTFAAPVRLTAGNAFLGEGRLYPSPVFHDLNGDGRLDIVVGDLRGRLTVALREPDAAAGDGTVRYGEEKPVKALDGTDLDFKNW